MKVEVVIRPEAPLARETVERQLGRRLDHLDVDGDDVTAKLGWSSRFRACLHFFKGADGESDRTRVASLDVKVELEDARDVESVAECCHDLASALDASLCSLDGGMLDPAGVTALIRASTRAERRFRALLGAAGRFG